MADKVSVRVSPSLALIKYWGKKNRKNNIPATSSLALSLDTLSTTTEITFSDARDSVSVNGEVQESERYAAFFAAVRKSTQSHRFYKCTSTNSFPTAAGLASSASGFAALALGTAALSASDMDRRAVSALARIGSASAARAVYGGVTILPRGAEAAKPLRLFGIWKDTRIIAVCTSAEQKSISSRKAMELCRQTSPYYRNWLSDSEKQFGAALKAYASEDREQLGELMRLSYMRMFSTMLSAAPPVLYWLPRTVRLIQLCAELRGKGIPAWETIDAGPQVKIITDTEHSDQVKMAVLELDGGLTIFEDKIGSGPEITIQ